jgi:hypothetical protein
MGLIKVIAARHSIDEIIVFTSLAHTTTNFSLSENNFHAAYKQNIINTHQDVMRRQVE